MFRFILSARKVWLGVFGLFVSLLCYPSITSYAAQITPAQQQAYNACLAGGGATAGTSARQQYCATTYLSGTTEQDKQEFAKNDSAPSGSLDISDKTIGLILSYLSQVLVQMLTFALGAVGILFNVVVYDTIINMKTGLTTSGISSGIDVAWKLIRDLINMSFIFILLFQSIQLILGRTSDAGKVIVKIAAVALFINFSMFITQVVVDSSNVISIGFYDAITVNSDAAKDKWSGGLSDVYMEALGLQSIWQDGFDALSSNQSGANYLIALTNYGASTFIIVTLFVFIAVTLMLLVRYIMIIFLMILSPIAFVGYILPGLKQYSDKWWNTLIGQSFFAPVFMIMTWVNLTLISSLIHNSDTHSAANGLGGIFALGNSEATFTDNAVNSLFNFTLIIGMAIASLIIAKQLASKGGSEFSKLTGAIGGAALGASAWTGRRFGGWAGQRISEDERVKDLARNGKYGLKYIGQAGLWTGEKAATSSFDARNAPLGIGSTILGDMGKAGGEGGYRKVAEKKSEAYQESIKRRAGASKETRGALSAAQTNLKTAQATLATKKSGDPDYLTAQQAVWDAQKEVSKQEKAVDRETKSSIKQMASELPSSSLAGKIFIPNQVARRMTAEKLAKTEDKAEKEKEAIDSINDHIKSILGTKIASTTTALTATEAANLNATFKSLTGKQISQLPAGTLKSPHLTQYMTPQILKTLQDKDELDEEAKQTLRNNLNDFITKVDKKAGAGRATPEEIRTKDTLERYLGTPKGADYWT